jgi:hypothetical protein
MDLNTESTLRAKAGLPEGGFDALDFRTQERLIELEADIILKEREIVKMLGDSSRKQETKPKKKTKKGLPIFRSKKLFFDLSCEFTSNENAPIAHVGGQVLGFRKESIYALEKRAEALFEKAHSVKSSIRMESSYMLFHIYAGGTRRCGTRAIAVDKGKFRHAVDTLFEDYNSLISDITKCKEGYEFLFRDDTSHTHFYFVVRYYPSPKSSKNWGESLKAVEQRVCFDLFTASDPNVNCVLQCAKRIFGPDATENSLKKMMLKTQKICIVNLVKGSTIGSLNTYKDLKVDPISPIKTIHVIDPDCHYLLLHNEHVGVLENFREQRRNRFFTSFRPLLKFPNCEKVTVAFDIECYFDPGGDQNHVPYLCCACFIFDDKPGNVVEFLGKDCVAQMIDYCADVAEEFKHENIELIAHNGGGYDFHYILTCFDDPSIITDIMIRNNHFISFKFTHHDICFSVKDSLNFLSCSLASAAKSFLGPQDRKTDFPHHELRTEEDLKRVFRKWSSIDKSIHVNVEKQKMYITSEQVVKYSEKDTSNTTLLDWSRIYCSNDVIVLAKVWIAFKKTVFNVFKCHIVEDTLTLAGMSFRLFEAYLPPNVRLHHTTFDDFHNMRAALIGGRCISVNGIYEDIACLDVKSLYPAAMAYYDQPYGAGRKVTSHLSNELGIYYVKVTPVHVTGHGFFPLRNNGGVDYAGTDAEPYTAWYTSVDIDIGISEGHGIEYVPFDGTYVGYSWKYKGKIFKDYIEGVLYELKLRYEKEKNKEKRWVIKIIMNSLWGKFAQKWMDTEYKIQHEDQADLTLDRCYKIFDTDFMLVNHRKERTLSAKPVQNGVFVLSWARHHMKRIWDKMGKADYTGIRKCIYSDTDSIFVAVSEIDMHATFELDGRVIPVIGDAMGQLEVEYVFHQLICVGKKQYMGSYTEDGTTHYKKRFKGVPQEYIKPRLYSHLLLSPDHTAQINFLKFKREWGSVSGHIESKTVRQT